MEKGSSLSSASSSSSSSPSSAFASGGPDSSLNGFKFGKKIYYEGVGPKPSGGPGKKGRSGLVHTARCQVEGCKTDLSGVKAYYSRHKVCGMHSKSPKVIVAGIEQRFCQQCSRFHQLPEFDQGKRSCRRRLAGHNERRRKPPQGSLLSPRYATLCPSMFDNNQSSKTGGFVMDFSCAYPSLAGRDLFPNPTSERGLTNNEAAITGKSQLPMLSISSTNPLSDLLTTRPSYSHRPAVAVSPEDGSFNSALSLLSSLPWAGPKGRLGVNNFLGQPPDDPPPPPGSSVGQFVCSPWSFKGNGDNSSLHEIRPPDLGLGQSTNGQYNNGGPELGQRSEISLQFHEMDQATGYDSLSSVQHNMHWSL